jgi:hypothetical protein
MAGTLTQLIQVIMDLKDNLSNKMAKPTQQMKSMKKVADRLNITTGELKKRMDAAGLSVRKNGVWQNKYTGEVMKTTKATGILGKTMARFKMHLLSVMFFGMLLQRTFGNIMRAGVTAFTKLMESNDMLGTAVQRLGVHFEYLKFIIGSAINRFLEPLMPLIIRIISAISEWIQKHPKLTAILIIFGFILGFLLFMFGTLGLGIQGLTQAFPFLASAVKGVGAAIVWLVTNPIGWIILALLALAIMWETNFLNIRGITADFVTWFIENVWNRGLNTIFSWIIKGLKVLWVSWKTNFMNMWDIMKVVWEGIKVAVGTAWNSIMSFIESGVNFFIKSINAMISAYNAIAGILGMRTINPIKLLDLGRASIDLKSFANTFASSMEKITDRSESASEEIRGILSQANFQDISTEKISAIGKAIENFSIVGGIKEGLNSAVGSLGIEEMLNLQGGNSGSETNITINNNTDLNGNGNKEIEELIDKKNKELEKNIRRYI